MADPEQGDVIEAQDTSEGSSELSDSDSGFGELSLSTRSLHSSIVRMIGRRMTRAIHIAMRNLSSPVLSLSSLR